MVLMVERNRGEHLIRRFTGRGNQPDPRDKRRKLSPTSGTMGQRTSILLAEETLGFMMTTMIALYIDNEEEESIPVYDIDIEYVIEKEEGFVGKGGFGGEEDNIEDVVVVANDLYSDTVRHVKSDWKKDAEFEGEDDEMKCVPDADELVTEPLQQTPTPRVK
ncbi:hypothetical protein Tco_0331646 [Tanacetum coccineum]